MVIAHRGASASAPEHTLAAYEQALRDGADGWECDVRMTMDGHLVCVHDRKLHRTSNGRGAVTRRELVELQRLDFVSWKPGWAHRGAGQLDAERGVLTLCRLLEFFVDCGSPLRLLIETKHPSRYRGHVERTLVGLLRRFGLHNPSKGTESSIVVMSKSPQALRRVQLLAPRLPTAQLFVAVPPRRRPGFVVSGGAPIMGPWLGALRYRPDYVARAHREGKQVYVWTVNRPADVVKMVQLDVDAVITNRPKQVREQLDAAV